MGGDKNPGRRLCSVAACRSAPGPSLFIHIEGFYLQEPSPSDEVVDSTFDSTVGRAADSKIDYVADSSVGKVAD